MDSKLGIYFGWDNTTIFPHWATLLPQCQGSISSGEEVFVTKCSRNFFAFWNFLGMITYNNVININSYYHYSCCSFFMDKEWSRGDPWHWHWETTSDSLWNHTWGLCLSSYMTFFCLHTLWHSSWLSNLAAYHSLHLVQREANHAGQPQKWRVWWSLTWPSERSQGSFSC